MSHRNARTPKAVQVANTKPARFVAIPGVVMNAVADQKISLDAGFLYLLLLHHHDTAITAGTWPTRAELARSMGPNLPNGIDKYLNELRDNGFLTWADTPFGTTYMLLAVSHVAGSTTSKRGVR